MDAELKERWATALESGDYTQGVGGLCTVDRRDGKERFCCLGVLLDLIDPEAWSSSERTDYKKWGANGANALGCVPEDLAESIGLHAAHPETSQHQFINANDMQGKRFPEIAAMVRALP
jgi:hypothetical protein